MLRKRPITGDVRWWILRVGGWHTQEVSDDVGGAGSGVVPDLQLRGAEVFGVHGPGSGQYLDM